MEVEIRDSHVDDMGVEDAIEATESFVKAGEAVERDSVITILEDDALCIGQDIQGMHESVYISEELVEVITNWYRNHRSCSESHMDWMDYGAEYCLSCGVHLEGADLLCLNCGSTGPREDGYGGLSSLECPECAD